MSEQPQQIHIDVGYSRGTAFVLGIQPTTFILCGAKDGDIIRDDRTAIRANGGYPAACSCGACKRIAELMYEFDLTPDAARKRYYHAK